MKKFPLILILLVGICLAFVPRASTMDEKPFFLLQSEPSGYKYHLEITSFVEREKDKSNINNFLKEFERMAGQPAEINSEKDIYKYTYMFKNLGETKLKINFSEWKFVHSPLTDILQDYSFTLFANETKVVTFLANGKPAVISSAINLGWWGKSFYGKNEKWNFAGVGSSSFYIPPWNGMYLEIK